ncbi:MAG: hypothetical protein MAG471_01734 [Acidimicrobiaceae bacterium]|nr:hypothetical protein [Acidimicrobiaceae bacterium]
MAKTIQVRDVGDETHRALAERADAAGLSLSQYLREELDRLAGRISARQAFDLFTERLPASPLSADVIVKAIGDDRAGR